MLIERRTIFRNLSYACLGLLAIFCLWHTVNVAAQGSAAIAQGYKTTETNIAPGALMSIKTDDNSVVELANSTNVEHLVGVVGADSLVELGSGSQNIQVVTSGITQALVSDANGAVNAGDKITASPISGVGMKATDSVQVVGVAQSDLGSAVTKTETVTDVNGGRVVVHVALLPVQVNVSLYAPPNDSSFVPGFLQDFANSVSGKEVSPVRVLVATLILVLAFISIAVLLYSTVRSSIISIGRNPLSERAVQKSIFQIGLTVIGILLLTLITIYLILTT